MRRANYGRGAGLAGLAAAVLTVAGCGGGNPQLTGAEVSGVVRHKGQLLTGGSIRLVNPTDPNKSMTGRILGDGTYVVPNAPVGEVVAVVETESAKSDPSVYIAMARAKGGNVDPSIAPQQGPPLKYVPINKKYNNPSTSPLKMTVGKGANKKDWDLD